MKQKIKLRKENLGASSHRMTLLILCSKKKVDRGSSVLEAIFSHFLHQL